MTQQLLLKEKLIKELRITEILNRVKENEKIQMVKNGKNKRE